MIKITEEEYASLCESNTTMLVLFGATWCQPCQQVAQVLADMEPDYDDQILFAKADVDEHENLTAELGIRSVPTLFLINGGEPISSLVGAQSRGKIEAFLRSI